MDCIPLVTDSLLVVGEPLVDDLADAGVQTVELLVLRGDARRRRLGGEDVHQSRQQRVYRADDLRVGTRHAGGDAAL